MQRIDSSLITPIYVKQDLAAELPTDPVYYLLASNKLFLCRNHLLYRSCVPAPQGPTELVPHAASLVPKFPPIPVEQLEMICGFFAHMSDEYGAEAIALLAWDREEKIVRIVVPLQVAAVSGGSGQPAYPIGVKYQFPRDLPKHWLLFCDIHSHCQMAAYASQTDIADEDNFDGLHIVVGRLHQEPPEFHVEVAVDGSRFNLEQWAVADGYQRRSQFPTEWLEQVIVTNFSTFREFDFELEEQRRAARLAEQAGKPPA